MMLNVHPSRVRQQLKKDVARGLGAAQTLAEYIARMEGYQVAGSLAQRNNNPGNLRAGAGQVGTANGFAVFATPEAGWAALDRQIALDAGRGLTLQQFIYKYAPPSENNSAAYLDFVAKNLGVSPSTPLAQVASGNSAVATEPQGAEESPDEEETGVDEPSSDDSEDQTGLFLLAGAAVVAIAILR